MPSVIFIKLNALSKAVSGPFYCVTANMDHWGMSIRNGRRVSICLTERTVTLQMRVMTVCLLLESTEEKGSSLILITV